MVVTPSHGMGRGAGCGGGTGADEPGADVMAEGVGGSDAHNLNLSCLGAGSWRAAGGVQHTAEATKGPPMWLMWSHLISKSPLACGREARCAGEQSVCMCKHGKRWP